MPAAQRLLAAFLFLIGAFLVLVGLAVASLYTVGQPVLAAVVATAGAAGVGAGGLTYWLLRRETEADPILEEQIEIDLEAVRRVAPRVQEQPITRMPLRVHSMPVADLPAPYVNAVMRGAQARLSALKHEAQQGGALQ